MELIAGRYELVREIGRGASATVYLAHDRTLGRDIAIKLVAPALANDPSFVDRFMREARLSASLQHPHIVTVHDVGETEDHRPFLAMALVDGVSLEKVIETSAPLPVGEASRILSELASALDYLHAQGLIHRDVKPSNVLIEESGRVMLTDFGIAYARESARYTMTGILLGTPRYMAPEQMLGEEPTAQTDVYAMGVLAFEMLAGAPPFEGTGTGLMYKIVHEPPPPIRAHSPQIPAGIEEAIARALAKDPAARWASPGEFAAAFASPDANATLSGPGRVFGVSSSPTQPEREEPAGGDEPSALAADGDSASSGGGRKRTLIGAGAAGIASLVVASYCLAGAGSGQPSEGDDEAAGSPSATVTTSAFFSPSRSPDSAFAPSETPTSVTTTAPPTVGGALPTATRTAAPTFTATEAPSATLAATSTPSPTATASSTASPTASATATSTSTATPTVAPPNPPSNVTLNGNTLSWSDNSNNETGFRIYWRSTTIGSGVTSTTNDKSVGANVTTTSVATIFLTADQTDFRRGVAAFNAAGQSTIVWAP